MRWSKSVCAQRLGVQELTQRAADTLRQIDKQTKQSRRPVRPVTKAATTTTRSRTGSRAKAKEPVGLLLVLLPRSTRIMRRGKLPPPPSHISAFLPPYTYVCSCVHVCACLLFYPTSWAIFYVAPSDLEFCALSGSDKVEQAIPK